MNLVRRAFDQTPVRAPQTRLDTAVDLHIAVMDDNAARVNGRLTSKHLPTIDVLITVGVMGDLGVMGSTNNIKAYMESRNL